MGAQDYGIDLKLPGMLNAAIKAAPVFGAKLKSFDATKVASLRGVKTVVPVGLPVSSCSIARTAFSLTNPLSTRTT